jgi:hypothetical protein
MNDNVENNPKNMQMIRARIKAVLGTDYTKDDLVKFVANERLAVRRVISEEILPTLLKRYGSLDGEQLETLIWIVDWFVQDPSTGEITLLKPPPQSNSPTTGLRLV